LAKRPSAPITAGEIVAIAWGTYPDDPSETVIGAANQPLAFRSDSGEKNESAAAASRVGCMSQEQAK
jgi:hypothetical protein